MPGGEHAECEHAGEAALLVLVVIVPERDAFELGQFAAAVQLDVEPHALADLSGLLHGLLAVLVAGADRRVTARGAEHPAVLGGVDDVVAPDGAQPFTADLAAARGVDGGVVDDLVDDGEHLVTAGPAGEVTTQLVELPVWVDVEALVSIVDVRDRLTTT